MTTDNKDDAVQPASGIAVPELVRDIATLIEESKRRAAQHLNAELTGLYWHVGKRLARDVLGDERGAYGQQVIVALSRELTARHGRGWSAKQLRHCLSDKPASDAPRQRRELLDFLELNDSYLEKDLEDAILQELQQFLLEMGSGFSFVARQYRIQVDDDDYYIDLLFYNRKLRRLVVIDLKVGSFKPEYKGQMELYLRWLAKYEQEPGEAPPLGVILCAGKKQEQIELLELDAAGIHVAEYLTALPSREILQQRLHEAVSHARARLNAREDEGER